MKHVVNVAQGREPDLDPRSLRARVKDRQDTPGAKKEVLRDTYYLITRKDEKKEKPGPTRRLTAGHTTIYPTGSTTGHAHDDMEEIYYFVSGEGEMVVGDDRFDVKAGDCCYVPPGSYHTTVQKGIMPLVIYWMTCRVDGDESLNK